MKSQVVFVPLVAFSAFGQGFMGLGFSIIAPAGAAFIPWDLEGVTMVIPVICFASLGHYLTRRFSSSLFEKVVYSFIGFTGVINIVRSLL